MIKILEGTIQHVVCCPRCKVWIGYERSDCKEDPDRDGVYLTIRCPAPDCGVGITVGVR